MADEYINYSLGLITSVNIKRHTQLQNREPTLEIYQQMSPEGHIEPTVSFKLQHSFTVPVDYLDTPKQCENWIELKLRSIGLQRVASETSNPKFLLSKLIWNMKLEAREVYTGVVVWWR